MGPVKAAAEPTRARATAVLVNILQRMTRFSATKIVLSAATHGPDPFLNWYKLQKRTRWFSEIGVPKSFERLSDGRVAAARWARGRSGRRGRAILPERRRVGFLGACTDPSGGNVLVQGGGQLIRMLGGKSVIMAGRGTGRRGTLLARGSGPAGRLPRPANSTGERWRPTRASSHTPKGAVLAGSWLGRGRGYDLARCAVRMRAEHGRAAPTATVRCAFPVPVACVVGCG